MSRLRRTAKRSPKDELDAAKGLMMGCLLGAALWLLFAVALMLLLCGCEIGAGAAGRPVLLVGLAALAELSAVVRWIIDGERHGGPQETHRPGASQMSSAHLALWDARRRSAR